MDRGRVGRMKTKESPIVLFMGTSLAMVPFQQILCPAQYMGVDALKWVDLSAQFLEFHIFWTQNVYKPSTKHLS